MPSAPLWNVSMRPLGQRGGNSLSPDLSISPRCLSPCTCRIISAMYELLCSWSLFIRCRTLRCYVSPCLPQLSPPWQPVFARSQLYGDNVGRPLWPRHSHPCGSITFLFSRQWSPYWFSCVVGSHQLRRHTSNGFVSVLSLVAPPIFNSVASHALPLLKYYLHGSPSYI